MFTESVANLSSGNERKLVHGGMNGDNHVHIIRRNSFANLLFAHEPGMECGKNFVWSGVG